MREHCPIKLRHLESHLVSRLPLHSDPNNESTDPGFASIDLDLVICCMGGDVLRAPQSNIVFSFFTDAGGDARKYSYETERFRNNKRG